jgi:quercetin dioxygenase-like cupin family protein
VEVRGGDNLAPVQMHRSSKADDDNREAVMKSTLLSALVLSAVVWPAAAYSQTGAAAMGTAVKEDDIKWEPLDGGFEISILYKNPTTQATYLVIRGPGNLHVPKHWHTSNESITVLKGSFVVAHDGSNDKTELKPGGFAYMPAKMIHEAWTGDAGATYFITVDGKWDVNFVK